MPSIDDGSNDIDPCCSRDMADERVETENSRKRRDVPEQTDVTRIRSVLGELQPSSQIRYRKASSEDEEMDLNQDMEKVSDDGIGESDWSTLWSTLDNAYLTCGVGTKEETPLVGKAMLVSAKLLQKQVPAILDTGSMISIVPVGILARAQDAGFDIDSLEVLPRESMGPVYDASNNQMVFLGAVKLNVELEGGKKVEVAFHISDEKGESILLGTNALGKLGVQVLLSPETPSGLSNSDVQRVTVARRIYIPPYSKALVSARCEGDSEELECVVWPSKAGMAAGVCRVRDHEMDMPVINNTENPMILREGEVIGQWGTDKEATLATKTEKGHLEYICKDGCLKDVKLGNIEGIPFPGAVANRPFANVWQAWRAASVFVRTDIEFLCATDKIRKHEKIDSYGFEEIYNMALQKLRKSLESEGKPKRPIHDGPTGFAAPSCAALLEKDGPRRGICTRVAATFRQLGEILKEWSANKIWVLVWPMEKGFKDKDISEILKACEHHFEDGGRIITAWPPVVQSNVETWKNMAEIWSRMDQAIERRSGCGQFCPTASSRVENDKVFCEVGTPEEALSFYGSDVTVSCAKVLYETIRKKVSKFVSLPELRKVEYQLMRTSAGERGGMWQSRPNEPPVKRRDPSGSR
ncbi:unnamed protein product [Heligmosomoides polygyrus]|uniref:Peptidase A2 domain-containing protein n=1 Tax=Heligmosomoides polygyrus TaxID=6339 RepID=A0A183F2N3_HELPZ|nr:unnamed protein product [Heligmosomoides polygyrus]